MRRILNEADVYDALGLSRELVGKSVGWLVDSSVGRLVRWSVGHLALEVA